MLDYPEADLVATERAAMLAWWLARGQRLTTRGAAVRLGYSVSAAHHMLHKLERVIPIERRNGLWQRKAER